LSSIISREIKFFSLFFSFLGIFAIDLREFLACEFDGT
jgi:hypothetical protein